MGEEAAEASSAAVPTVLTTAEMLALDVFRAAEAMAVVVMGMSMEHRFSECI